MVKGEEVVHSSGYFEYVISDDGTAKITACTKKGDIVIPSTIDGYTVTQLEQRLFYGLFDITHITIPATVKAPGNYDYVFSYCYDLQEIEVDEDNPYLESRDGVLFSEDMTVLYNYPSAKTGITYYVPETVQTICCTGFAYATIQTLYLMNRDTIWLTYTFWGCSDMTIMYKIGGNSEKRVNLFIENGYEHKVDNRWPCYEEWEDASENQPSTEEPVIPPSTEDPTTEEPTPEDPVTPPADIPTPNVDVSYHTHIQTLGDSQGTKKNGEMAGTSGMAKRLENIWIKVEGNDNLGIQYTTHCQTYGWMPWSCDGESNGTSGEAKRLEAIKIQLTGADKDKYDVYYRVHAQSYGWLGWAKNGEPSGTAGYGKRLEGIQVVVVKKGEAAPGLKYAGVDGSSSKYGKQAYVAKTNETIKIPGNTGEPNVMYKTHVQTFGWQKWMVNGQMSGTSGKAKRLEGINIKLTNAPYEGDIVYTTHVQKYGWKDGKPDADKSTWKKNGEMSGTNGEAKRLEAICIDLTGEMAEHYDVYYRVHAQTFGWLGWAKNGEESGTAGYAKRLEGIQIVLVPKGGDAPADNYGGIDSKNDKPFIEKK